MLKVKAWAKFNLNLHILPKKRANNYSEIRTINCRLSLADELIFEKKLKKIELIDQSGLDKTKNTVYQAAEILKKEANNPNLGIKIKLIKKIPIKAGLGGESADAAITLLALNKIWQLNYSLKKLQTIGGQIGTDLYFCLVNQLAEVSGIGEKIKRLNYPMPTIYGILINPEVVKPSVAWAYNQVDRQRIGQNIFRTALIKRAIKEKNLKEVIKNLFNDFEESIIRFYPVVTRIKEDLENAGALNSLMAGSGLSVMGFFENKKRAEKANKLLKNKGRQSYLVWTR